MQLDQYCNSFHVCCNGKTSTAINEYFFGVFYFISYSLVQPILSTTLMSSNIVTYMLLHQVFYHALVLVLYD